MYIRMYITIHAVGQPSYELDNSKKRGTRYRTGTIRITGAVGTGANRR
jgi:hypothetical protein